MSLMPPRRAQNHAPRCESSGAAFRRSSTALCQPGYKHLELLGATAQARLLRVGEIDLVPTHFVVAERRAPSEQPAQQRDQRPGRETVEQRVWSDQDRLDDQIAPVWLR